MISRPCTANSFLKVASRPTVIEATLPFEQSGTCTRSGRGTVTRSWLPRPKMAAPAATAHGASGSGSTHGGSSREAAFESPRPYSSRPRGSSVAAPPCASKHSRRQTSAAPNGAQRFSTTRQEGCSTPPSGRLQQSTAVVRTPVARRRSERTPNPRGQPPIGSNPCGLHWTAATASTRLHTSSRIDT